MNIFKMIKAKLVYSLAVQKANDAHEETGERYYVMPSTDGKLVVVDRRNFRLLKRKHYINQNANIGTMHKECFYCTPYRNGSGEMPDEVRVLKKAAYMDWVNRGR